MNRYRLQAIVVLLGVIVLCYVSGRDFTSMWLPDALHPCVGVTSKRQLSSFCAGLAGTRFDSPIYYLEGANPGPTLLVLGGTHPNESAGYLTAVVLLENCRVNAGRLIVIPQACLSGFTCTDPLEGYPERFTIQTKTGPRTFKFGSRGANPVDQWPDPLVFLQYPSGQQLSGNETRNLNRSYPGKIDGTPVQQSAYAIMQLIERERVDVALDLHEAAPEIPIINAIVTHPKGKEIAAAAVLNLEFEGLSYSLEMSPDNFRGLSHREWGDRTSVFPFLMETSNPIQGRLRGVTDIDLLVNGKDIRYARAAQLGTMRITYEMEGEPLSLRVGRHLQGLLALIAAYNDLYPERSFSISNIPTYSDMMSEGIGMFLH